MSSDTSTVTATGLSLAGDHQHEHDRAATSLSGFWVFMMSDLIIFSMFFANYATMLTAKGLADGPGPHNIFQLSGVTIETGALLLSTFTFGLASLAIRHDRGRGKVLFWLVVTLALGAVFLGYEVKEFSEMFAEGAVPQRSGYLSAFFSLVPLHGLHVTSGSIWLILMIYQVVTVGLTDEVKSRLARLALFWHFLDIIWIGIFSVVYLGGLA